ncbi:MAG: hypothetical protein WCG66_00935 [bacterium]
MRVGLVMSSIILPSVALAQDFVAPRGVQRDITSHPLETNPEIAGIVGQIFNESKPWQLLNPSAPASFGNGAKNVSKDASAGTPHQATTLTIIGIEW